MELQPQNTGQKRKRLIAGHPDINLATSRYYEVGKFITNKKYGRVLDLGCNQGHFIRRLTRSIESQLIVGLDINKPLLEDLYTKRNIAPENQHDFQEHYYQKKNPLITKLYHGDLLKPYSNLRNYHFDVITLIEVIQHLKLEDHPALNKTLFEYYQPKLVVMTTPNCEFNVYFEFKPNQLRHKGHYFEWSQAQFKQYCEGVVKQYPYYSYEIFGVGEHLTDGIKNGYCSQGAAFFKKEDIDISISAYSPSELFTADLIVEEKYLHWHNTYKRDIANKIADICRFFDKDHQGIFYSLDRILQDYMLDFYIKSTSITMEEILQEGKICKRLVWNEKGEVGYNFEADEVYEDDENDCEDECFDEGENNQYKEYCATIEKQKQDGVREIAERGNSLVSEIGESESGEKNRKKSQNKMNIENEKNNKKMKEIENKKDTEKENDHENEKNEMDVKEQRNENAIAQNLKNDQDNKENNDASIDHKAKEVENLV